MLTEKEMALLGRIFIAKDSPKNPDDLLFWKIIGFETDEKDGERKAVCRCDKEIKGFTLETNFFIKEKDLEEQAMFVDNIIRGLYRTCQGNF